MTLIEVNEGYFAIYSFPKVLINPFKVKLDEFGLINEQKLTTTAFDSNIYNELINYRF